MRIVQRVVYRVTFLLLTLVLSFLFYPARARGRDRVTTLDAALIQLMAMLGILVLATGIGGWMRGPSTAIERALAIGGGTLLFYSGTFSDAGGFALFAAAVLLHLFRVWTKAVSPSPVVDTQPRARRFDLCDTRD